MHSQTPGQTLNAYAYEDIALTNAGISTLTAANVTPTDPNARKIESRPRLVMITNDGGAVRWRVDGGNPATAGGSGHLLNSADSTSPIYLTDYNQMKNFKAICDTATASKLRVTYYR